MIKKGRSEELLIANKELAFQIDEKAKREAELAIAEKEKAKREAELVIANAEKAKRAAELIIANEEKAKRAAELVLANEEKGKRAAELVIANAEKAKRAAGLVIANLEKAKRADELIVADKELTYQNEEKVKRAAELVIADVNKTKREAELVIANIEKAKRVAKSIIADKELSYQTKEKSKRAAELVIADAEKAKREAELVIANIKKAKRSAELVIANVEKAKRSAELVIANKELVYQKSEKAKRAAELVIANVEKAKRAAEFVITNKELVLAKEKEKLVLELTIVNKELTYQITERKQAEKEVFNLNTQLEQHVIERTSQLEDANKELEAFAYSVSHDLRAPLRAVDGFSRIVMEDYGDKLDTEGKRMLGLIRSNTQKMDQLINDLLNLSRVSRRDLRYSDIDMTQMVISVFDETAPPDVKGNIRFQVDKLPDAFADPTFLKQVWFNLIANAIKFSSKKSKPEIKIGSRIENNTYTYFINDNGVGFNQEYGHKLFGVFQRLHKSEDFEGTGVGLAIVQRIIHRFDGKVWAESVEGKGATFYFSLPARK